MAGAMTALSACGGALQMRFISKNSGCGSDVEVFPAARRMGSTSLGLSRFKNMSCENDWRYLCILAFTQMMLLFTGHQQSGTDSGARAG